MGFANRIDIHSTMWTRISAAATARIPPCPVMASRALIMTATWVLATVARPYYWWRLGLVVFAYSFYLVMFAVPVWHDALTLDTTNPAMLTVGVVAGLIGMAAVEATWWITAMVRGERPRVWAAGRGHRHPTSV